MLSSITFHPTPGSPASPIAIHLHRAIGLTTRWDAVRECLAVDLGRHEADFDLEDVYWDTADGDDDRAEVVTLDGEIIGALDRALTAGELAAINGESPNARRAA